MYIAVQVQQITDILCLGNAYDISMEYFLSKTTWCIRNPQDIPLS